MGANAENTRAELRKHLAEQGITMREYIVKLYAQMGTQAAVARALGVGEGYISRTLTKSGMKPRAQQLTEQQIIEIGLRHGRGEAVTDIASAMGLKYHTVYFRLFPNRKKR